MRTTKPVAFPLNSNCVAQIKIAELAAGQETDSNIWTTSSAHPCHRFDPIRTNGDSGTVLCQFKVRKVICEYPVLKLQLSRNVQTILEKVAATSPLYTIIRQGGPTPMSYALDQERK